MISANQLERTHLQNGMVLHPNHEPRAIGKCECIQKGKMIKAEVVEMRKNLKGLRQFLIGCQDSINSETAKLQKTCLGRIMLLEAERSEMERKLCLAEEENKILIKNASELSQTVSELDSNLTILQRKNAELQSKNGTLESKLKVQYEQCNRLEREFNHKRYKCLEFENKLATEKAYIHEQKAVLCEIVEDQKMMKEENANLKLELVEDEAYVEALQEHVTELEAICSVLREQHDEQQKYFMQKEIGIKKEASERCEAAVKENQRLLLEVQTMRVQLGEMSSKISEKSKLLKDMKTQNFLKDETFGKLEKSVRELQEKLKIENSTVEMLNKKNSELSLQLAKAQREIRQLEDKYAPTLANTDRAANRKALKEIENTVQQYFNGQRKYKEEIANSFLSDSLKRVAEYEEQLANERKLRLSAEILAENLRVELEKAKVVSAMQRNHYMDNTVKRSKSLLLPHVTDLLYTPRAKKSLTIASSTVDLSEIRDNVDALKLVQIKAEEVGGGNNSLFSSGSDTSTEKESSDPRGEVSLHGLSITETREYPIGNEQDTPASRDRSAVKPTNSRVHSNTPPSICSDDTHSLAASDLLVSPRASQKVEEAKRKALAMLSGIPNWH